MLIIKQDETYILTVKQKTDLKVNRFVFNFLH